MVGRSTRLLLPMVVLLLRFSKVLVAGRKFELLDLSKCNDCQRACLRLNPSCRCRKYLGRRNITALKRPCVVYVICVIRIRGRKEDSVSLVAPPKSSNSRNSNIGRIEKRKAEIKSADWIPTARVRLVAA